MNSPVRFDVLDSAGVEVGVNGMPGRRTPTQFGRMESSFVDEEEIKTAPFSEVSLNNEDPPLPHNHVSKGGLAK